MSVDDATWGEIRRCYVDGCETVGQIATRFGVSVGAVWYRVRRDDWARRSSRARSGGVAEGVAGCEGGSAKTGSGKKRTVSRKGNGVPNRTRRAKSSADPLATREEVVGRLYRAILKKLSNLEARMEGEQALSAAESERETRELSTMVRSFEKVTGVAADIAKERKPKAGERARVTADAERMRSEIAERLERLDSQRNFVERPGEPG